MLLQFMILLIKSPNLTQNQFLFIQTNFNLLLEVVKLKHMNIVSILITYYFAIYYIYLLSIFYFFFYFLVEQPITDIVIIYSETSKAPPGYVLLQRTASGISAANLNSGNSGKQLYICYSRVIFFFNYLFSSILIINFIIFNQSVEKPPITGVAIIFPEFDKKPPPTFEAILETPAAEPASLNIGNEGTEAFLCVSRAEGTPITGLTLVNETEDYILPEDFRILELSPEGHKANINKRAGGDRLFLSYKGGHNSYFGFPKGMDVLLFVFINFHFYKY